MSILYISFLFQFYRYKIEDGRARASLLLGRYYVPILLYAFI